MIIIDTFLNNENFYQRLLMNYKEYGKIIVAYDFDDTVSPCRGTDCSMIIDLIRQLKPYSHLICFTARNENELDMVKRYLIENDIPFNYINKEWNGEKISGKKIYYNILLDDKCGLSCAYEALTRLLREIKGEEL